MGLMQFVRDTIDPGPWLSITIQNKLSGKSITLFHHQADPGDVEQSLREVLDCFPTRDAEDPLLSITIAEAKWLSDALKRCE